jgi:hypothetical protein
MVGFQDQDHTPRLRNGGHSFGSGAIRGRLILCCHAFFSEVAGKRAQHDDRNHLAVKGTHAEYLGRTPRHLNQCVRLEDLGHRFHGDPHRPGISVKEAKPRLRRGFDRAPASGIHLRHSSEGGEEVSSPAPLIGPIAPSPLNSAAPCVCLSRSSSNRAKLSSRCRGFERGGCIIGSVCRTGRTTDFLTSPSTRSRAPSLSRVRDTSPAVRSGKSISLLFAPHRLLEPPNSEPSALASDCSSARSRSRRLANSLSIQWSSTARSSAMADDIEPDALTS